MIVLTSFAPDNEPDATGAIIECSNIIPSDRGFKPRPDIATTGTSALASDCRGIMSVRKTDTTIRTVAGTSTNLYDLSGTSWSSVLSGKSLGSEDRWKFAQFGNVTLAVTPTEKIHYSTSGAFSAITPTVKAKYIASVNGFLIAGNYNNGSDDNKDGWICSGYQNHLDWTPSAATQCATGRLLDTPGEITSVRSLGANCVIYQEHALHLGVYVGSPVVWNFQKIYGNVGCLAHGLIVSNEQYHLFFGNDDVYRFDGSNLNALQSPCSRFVIDRLNKSATYACESAWDNDRGLAWWFFPSSGQTQCDSYVCYHPETGKWGYGSLTIEAVVQYISGGFTYDTAPTDWTYDDAPQYPYDSSFWTATTTNLSVVSTDHVPYVLNGAGVDSSMTLYEMGSDSEFTHISRIKPRFYTQPTTASLTAYAKYNADGSFVQSATSTLVRGKFDFLASAMWHKVKIDLTGNYEILGIEVDAQSDGEP